MDLRRKVSITIRYSDYFHYPLNPEEIWYWLVSSRPVSFGQIKKYLPRALSPAQKKLKSKVSVTSAQKLSHARKLVRILKYVPGVRLIAITGSVAAGNSYPEDDIDLLFITGPHSLWLVRPVILFLISLFFRRRHPGEDHSKATNAFCPNLWLDTLAISMPNSKRNLYTAHEVLQIIPLVDKRDTYRQFLINNSWAKKYLANAYASLSLKEYSPDHRIHPFGLQPSLFVRFFIFPLNYLFYIFQLIYMFPKKTTETVNLHSAFLHTTDFKTKINRFIAHPLPKKGYNRQSYG